MCLHTKEFYKVLYFGKMIVYNKISFQNTKVWVKTSNYLNSTIAHTTSFKKIHFIVVKCIFSKRPVLLSPRPFCLLKHTKFIKAIVVVVEMREGGY